MRESETDFRLKGLPATDRKFIEHFSASALEMGGTRLAQRDYMRLVYAPNRLPPALPLRPAPSRDWTRAPLHLAKACRLVRIVNSPCAA